MKKLFYLLLALPLFVASCSNDGYEEPVQGEKVQVSFTAQLPVVKTRAVIDGTNIDEVVCAVFENDNEILALRDTVAVPASGNIEYNPTLIKGRKYCVVFWAQTAGAWNVANMKEISRNAGKEEALYDAFTTAHDLIAGELPSYSVNLVRPFAQLNIGVTAEELDDLKRLFGIEPATVELSLTNCRKAYNAYAGNTTSTTGDGETVNFTLTVQDKELEVAGVTYKQLSMCYVLMENDYPNSTLTYCIKDQNGKNILGGEGKGTIADLPLDKNHKTNVVGHLMTGDTHYTIGVVKAFDTPDNNKEL